MGYASLLKIHARDGEDTVKIKKQQNIDLINLLSGGKWIL